MTTYVKAHPNDEEFEGLTTKEEKYVKMYDRSAKDFAIKTGKFSNEVDLDEEMSPSKRNDKRRLFKKMMNRNKDYWQKDVEGTDRAHDLQLQQHGFNHDFSSGFNFPHHFHAGFWSHATPHAPSAGGVPPSVAFATAATPSMQSQTHSSTEQLNPINLFVFGGLATPASTQNKEDIAQLVTAMKIGSNNIDRVTTALIQEREERIEGHKRLEGDIRQLQQSRAEDTVEIQQPRNKVNEMESQMDEVNEMKSKMEEFLTPGRKKKQVVFKCSNEYPPIPPRHSAAKKPVTAKEPAAAKKTDKSTPAVTRSSTSSVPLQRRSTRKSVRTNGM